MSSTKNPSNILRRDFLCYSDFGTSGVVSSGFGSSGLQVQGLLPQVGQVSFFSSGPQQSVQLPQESDPILTPQYINIQ